MIETSLFELATTVAVAFAALKGNHQSIFRSRVNFITGSAEVVFSDTGEFIKGDLNTVSADDQLICIWESRMGILYANNNLLLDIKLVWWTFLAILARPKALAVVQANIRDLQANPDATVVSRLETSLELAILAV